MSTAGSSPGPFTWPVCCAGFELSRIASIGVFWSFSQNTWDGYPGHPSFGRGTVEVSDIAIDESIELWIQRTQSCAPESTLDSKLAPFMGVKRLSIVCKNFLMVPFNNSRGCSRVHVTLEQGNSHWWIGISSHPNPWNQFQFSNMDHRGPCSWQEVLLAVLVSLFCI